MRQQPREPQLAHRAIEPIGLGRVCAHAVMLLWVALLNGYPLVVADTIGYLVLAVDHRFDAPVSRPLGYSWFIYLSSLNISPWLTVVCQGALAAAVIAWFVKLSGFAGKRGVHSAGIVAVATLSSGPYFIGQVMPDFLSGLVPLVAYMLVSYYGRLGWSHRAWLAAFLLVATVCHLTSLVTVPITAVSCFLFLWRRGRDPLVKQRRRYHLTGMTLALGAVSLGALLIATSNLRAFGRFTTSPGKHVAALGRLLEDGLVLDHLKRACPEAGYRLCAEIDNLPATAEEFWWVSPVLARTGGWLDSREEFEQIMARVAAESPGVIAANAMSRWARLFVSVGNEPTLSLKDLAYAQNEINRLYPGDSSEFRASLQERGALASPLGRLHSLVITLAFWVFLVLAVSIAFTSRGTEQRSLIGTVVAFLLVNAFVCGALIGVNGRYQSRAAWVVVLIGSLQAAQRWLPPRRFLGADLGSAPTGDVRTFSERG